MAKVPRDDAGRWTPPKRRSSPKKATPSPPKSAPRQIAGPPRTGKTKIPGLSAQARAQRITDRWEEVFAPVERPENRPDPVGEILIPTEEKRRERDEALQRDPQQVRMDPMEWWALEMARQGNDVHLFDYQPTPSSNPPRPRTLAAGYTESDMTLRIRFRNGQVYGYYRVPPNVWRQFKLQDSPGKYINRVLNFYPYAPEPDLDRPTGRS